MRSKTKINRDLQACIFLRFEQLKRLCFEPWLVHAIGQRNSLVFRHRMGNHSTTRIITVGSCKRKAYNQRIVSALTLSIISSRALSACPISRIQWWMRPGPKRPCKDNKTIFPKNFYFGEFESNLCQDHKYIISSAWCDKYLTWAISNPLPGPNRMFSLGTRTSSKRTSAWPPTRSKRVSDIHISSFYQNIHFDFWWKLLPRYSHSIHQENWNIHMFGIKIPLCQWQFSDDWIQNSELLHFWWSSVIFHISKETQAYNLQGGSWYPKTDKGRTTVTPGVPMGTRIIA